MLIRESQSGSPFPTLHKEERFFSESPQSHNNQPRFGLQ
jgi:hypothetical protein